jgi:hypothetical protein
VLLHFNTELLFLSKLCQKVCVEQEVESICVCGLCGGVVDECKKGWCGDDFLVCAWKVQVKDFMFAVMIKRQS